MNCIRVSVDDLDLLVREDLDVPDDQDVAEYCEENGLEYNAEIRKALDRFLIRQEKIYVDGTNGRYVN